MPNAKQTVKRPPIPKIRGVQMAPKTKVSLAANRINHDRTVQAPMEANPPVISPTANSRVKGRTVHKKMAVSKDVASEVVDGADGKA